MTHDAPDTWVKRQLTDATLYFALGQTCEQIGEVDAALAAYHHAARLDSHNEVYHRQLGALLRNQGDDEGAAAALRRR